MPCVLRKLLGRVGALLCIWTRTVVHPSPQARVIQTKSTQRLSFSLTIATLLTSASWTLYGFRLSDPYIMVSSAGSAWQVCTVGNQLLSSWQPLRFQVPNVPGILTSFIRLWLFWKYPREQDRNYQLLQT